MNLRPICPDDKLAVQAVVRNAFSGHPWYEKYTQKELDKIWQSAINSPGFSGLVAKSGRIITGAIWWHLPTPNTISGSTLKAFLRRELANKTLVWEDAICVHQSFQRRGTGEILRRAFVSRVRETFRSALILSRMRSDNFPTLRLAEKVGYKRSGAQYTESTGGRHLQEYWYLII